MLAAIDVKWLINNPAMRWLLNLKDARLGDQVMLDLQKPIPLWLLVLIIAPVVFLIGLAYYKESRTAGAGWKIAMAGMRSFVALLILLIVMQPVVKSENSNLFRKVILVMIDTTGSMNTEDRNYDDETVQRIADGLYNLSGQDVRQLKRIDIVKDYLANPSVGFLKRLQEKGLVKIVTLDNESRPRYDDPKGFLQPAEGERFGAVDTGAIGKMEAKSVETNLSEAIRETITKAASEYSVAGIILISDGRSTAQSEDETEANKVQASKVIEETVSRAGIPIYCVRIGSEKPPKNLMAVGIEGPAKSTKDSIIPLDVYFKYEQYESGTVKVTLQMEDLDATGEDKGWKDVETQSVPIEKGQAGTKVRVRFNYKPKLKPDQKEAHYKFRAALESLPDEVDYPTEKNPVDLDNITDPPHYLDITDRRLNILYVEGTPRWEYRYLKNVLIRKKDEMVVWCLLLSADREFPQEHTQGEYIDEQGNPKKIEPLKAFPNRDELKKFDVIIWGDVDPTMNNFGIGRDACENIKEFVQGPEPGKPEEGLGGGGLICILGENYFPRLYDENSPEGAPLGEILPFKIEPPQDEDFYKDRTEAFKFRLTTEGRSSDLFRFMDDAQANEKYWGEGDTAKDEYGLPGVFWYWPIETDPSLTLGKVYVRHKTDKPKKADENTPSYALFFENTVGRGVVFVSAIDETWRWRYQYGDEPYFAPFWIRIIKRAAEFRLQSETRWYIRTDPKYNVKSAKTDKKMKIDAKSLTEDRKPLQDEKLLIWHKLRADSSEAKSMLIDKAEGENGLYSGELALRELEPGEYDIWIDEKMTPGAKAKASNFFVVKVEDKEHTNTTFDPYFLTKLAEATGTIYRPNGEDPNSPERLFPIYALGEIPDKIEGGEVSIVVSVSDIRTWASPLMFILILVLLCAEWIIRKWHKLI